MKNITRTHTKPMSQSSIHDHSGGHFWSISWELDISWAMMNDDWRWCSINHAWNNQSECFGEKL